MVKTRFLLVVFALMTLLFQRQATLHAEIKIGPNFYKKTPTSEDVEKMKALANTVINVENAPSKMSVEDAILMMYDQLEQSGWELVISFENEAFGKNCTSTKFLKLHIEGIGAKKTLTVEQFLSELVNVSPSKKTTFVIRPHFITFTDTERAMAVPYWTRWAPGEIK